MVTGLEVPWGVAFADETTILVTERPGRVRVIEDGTLRPEPVLSPDVVARGEGGLLGIALHPGLPRRSLGLPLLHGFRRQPCLPVRRGRRLRPVRRGGAHRRHTVRRHPQRRPDRVRSRRPVVRDHRRRQPGRARCGPVVARRQDPAHPARTARFPTTTPSATRPSTPTATATPRAWRGTTTGTCTHRSTGRPASSGCAVTTRST